MKKALVFSLAAMAVGVAQAQMSVGVEGGFFQADIDSVVASEIRSTGQSVTATTDDSSSGFRLFGSAPISGKTDIEFGFFTHSDFSVKYNFTFLPLVGTQTYSFSGLDLSAVHKPLNNGFFVKGGLHSSRYDIDTQVRGTTTGFTSSVSTSDTGIGYLAGLGYEATLSQGVKARASFVRYMNIGGESDLAMNLMTLGISKAF
jgi:hypothetical protein